MFVKLILTLVLNGKFETINFNQSYEEIIIHIINYLF